MRFNYVFYEKLPDKYFNEIKGIIETVDMEFVPPLSTRIATTQNKFVFDDDYKVNDSINLYLSTLTQQKFILAFHNEIIVGFLSFVENHTFEFLNIPSENIYITTVCVATNYRRCGISKELHVFLKATFQNTLIYTRTWNTNISHIALLKKKNYDLIYEIANDRGQGIDSVYYAKKITSCD